MRTGSTQVAVIGAGPYGLSVAAHLAARGVEHRVFGRLMSLWADHMPRGMYLKSEGHASNLSDPAAASTLRRFAQEHGRSYADLGLPVSLDMFTQYGRWFRQREVPSVDDVDVVSLTGTGSGFHLGLSDGGSVTAERVVLATGFTPFAHLPAELAGLPEELVTHSSAHDDLSRLAGQDVVVLGAGQSALESAALLAEAGARPQVLVRGQMLHWNRDPAGRALPARARHPVSRLGPGWRLLACDRLPWAFRRLPRHQRVDIALRALGPAGGWWLRDRVDDVIPVTTGAQVRAARPVGGAVELTVDGPHGAVVLHADHVLAGTGYRVDLGRLTLLDADLRMRIRTVSGHPVLDRGFESSVRGLHFVGLPAAASFGPVQRFVCGADFAARRVAAASSRQERSPASPVP